MPRPRKPTAVLKLVGAFKANPKRTRTDPEPSGPLGDPPEHLSEAERACWRELVVMSPPGVLTGGDAWAVEIAARLMAEYRADGRLFQAAKLSRLQAALGSLGLSPADRSRVSAIKAETAGDEWDEL